MARRPRGEAPHYVDLHVGGRIRSRRRALRLSMEALATELGVTHQAMQKYETGATRVSAPMLYEIAGALRIWVGELYEGLPSPADVSRLPPRTRDQVERFLAAPGGAELMSAFLALPRSLQRPLVDMALAYAGIEPDEVLAPPAPTRASGAQ